jgi:hypothetical protein
MQSSLYTFAEDAKQIHIARKLYYENMDKKQQLQTDLNLIIEALEEVHNELIRLDKVINNIKLGS